MTAERLVEYGLGTALALGVVAPLLWVVVRALLTERRLVVEAQERIAKTLENHLASIGRSLAAIEVRLANIDRRTELLHVVLEEVTGGEEGLQDAAS